jgi:hypothetical protein
MEDGRRLSAVVTGNQTFGLTRAALAWQLHPAVFRGPMTVDSIKGA